MYPKVFSTSLLLQLTFACGDNPSDETTTASDATESKTTEGVESEVDGGITQIDKPFYLYHDVNKNLSI